MITIRKPQFIHYLDDEDLGSEEPQTMIVEPDAGGLTIELPQIKQSVIIDYYGGNVTVAFCDEYGYAHTAHIIGGYQQR